MIKVLFMLFCLFWHSAVVTSQAAYVRAQVFISYDCQGKENTVDLNRSCFYWPVWGNEISGVWIREGSCVKLYKEPQCNGETTIIGYPEYRICRLPPGWNDHMFSLSSCDTRNVAIRCPHGSYVRQIEYGNTDDAFTLHCYKPSENTPTYSGSTGGTTPSNPTIKGCPVAAHGMSWEYTGGWNIYHTPRIDCTRPTEENRVPEIQQRFINESGMVEGVSENGAMFMTRTGYKSVKTKQICSDKGYAFSGLDATVDESGVIKEWNFFCVKVVDPTSMCEPQESLGLILHCDNSESSNEMECRFSKTVGVGQSRTMTELERQEMTFSMEMGYSIESGIPGLSATMSASLGFSELVGYEWSQSDTATWSEETTIEATIKVGPRSHSKLEQLVGKCSFYGTSTNYFKQTDVNVETGETTIKYFS